MAGGVTSVSNLDFEVPPTAPQRKPPLRSESEDFPPREVRVPLDDEPSSSRTVITEAVITEAVVQAIKRMRVGRVRINTITLNAERAIDDDATLIGAEVTVKLSVIIPSARRNE